MALAFCTVLAVTPQRAEAAITIDFDGSTFTVSSDAGDDITVGCKGGTVHVNGFDQGIACSGVATLLVNGGVGNNSIDLSAVAAPLQPSSIEVDAGAGNDVIVGSDLDIAEILRGGPGNDVIFGGMGNDRLFGDDGNDTLRGQLGDDVLNGGGGEDTFLYNIGDGGTDTIVEWIGEGSNDRAVFSSDQPGTYNVGAKGRVSRGSDELHFDGELERLTVQADTPQEGSDDDTFNVRPSPYTSMTLSDLGNSVGDVLNYDHDQQLACPVRVGDSIVSPGQLAPVDSFGIETIHIAVYDCQSGGTGNGIEDGCEILDCLPGETACADCGGNGVPDECDPIADCNGNGFEDVCEPDSDQDTVIDDCDNCTPSDPTHHCDNKGIECSNTDQLDADQDGVGDVCDNCIDFCNPDQTDNNANGIGDACEVRISGELRPPLAPGLPECDPDAPVTCDCFDYSAVDYAATFAAIDAACVGGQHDGDPCQTDADCRGTSNGVCVVDPDSSVSQPYTVSFYQNVYNMTGRLFAREIAPPGQTIPISIQWKDAQGEDVGNPVTYHLTDELPDEVDASADGEAELPYSVSLPSVFSNVIIDFPSTPLLLSRDYFPTIQYNTTIEANPVSELEPHFFFVAAGDNLIVRVLDSTPDGLVVVQWADGSGGVLQGLDVVRIQQLTPPVADVEVVGQQIDIPTTADCKAEFLANGVQQDPVAWQRVEQPLEIWPIKSENTSTRFQVIWYKTTPLDHCWHTSWTRHTANWPTMPQTYVIDPNNPPAPSLVALPLSESVNDYCNAEIAYFEPGTDAEVQGNRFDMLNPGFAVLRLDRKVAMPVTSCSQLPGTPELPRRGEVRFEVVRAYQFEDPAVFDNQVVDWRIGKQLNDGEHDANTPEWPFGYLRDGQPYAEAIYAGPPPVGTGQIFPVNSGDVHGLLKVWWFKEGTGAADIYWPHKVVHYNPFWPTAEDPDDPNDDPFELVIASRIGAGSYPDDANTVVYQAGEFGAGNSGALHGWNPNDEHARVIPSGGRKRAYAARDDDPWNSASGHPYVLVQYKNEPEPGLWNMGVHKVVGEDLVANPPVDFDYDAFVFEPPPDCGCAAQPDLLAECGFEDPNCGCDVNDPGVACAYSNPDCNCDDPNLDRECVGGNVPSGTPCVTNANCSGGQCVSVDPACPCNELRCVGGGSAGRLCFDVSDCDAEYSRICDDDSDPPNYCSIDSDCPGVPCIAARVCNGGGNAGAFCTLGSDCPGGDCDDVHLGYCAGGQSPGAQCQNDGDCDCSVPAGICVGGTQNECVGGTDDGKRCASDADCPDDNLGDCVSGFCVGGIQDGNACGDDQDCPPLNPGACVNSGIACDGMVCFGGAHDAAPCRVNDDCPGGACHDDCSVQRCAGSVNAGDLCADDLDCDCAGNLGVSVVAGLPLDPLFPVNFGAAPCQAGNPPIPQTRIVSVCVGGANDGTLCNDINDCPGGICTQDGLWVDRTGVIWAAEESDDTTGNLSAAAILLYENWVENGDIGCQPWRDFGTGNPTPINYRPSWPSTECNWPNDPTCPRPVRIGETVVDQTGQCGSVQILHDSAGIRIIDTTYETGVDFPAQDFPADIEFANLPPHLFGGTIGGSLPWPDRIDYDGQTLSFRGIMSDRDRLELQSLSTDSDYIDKIDELYHLSRVQVAGRVCIGGSNDGTSCTGSVDCMGGGICVPAFTPTNQKFISVSHSGAGPGWVVLAFQNDAACESVGSPTVQVWNIDCGPEAGSIRPLTPTCPFNEKQVMQHSLDAGGQPENLIYHWQWSDSPNGPWNNYAAPSGPPGCTDGMDCYNDGVGLREVIISGSSPFTLADTWWRVRYRGYPNCACDGGDCGEGGDPWPSALVDDGARISQWTDPQLSEGWIKRVIRGLNPFDQRIKDFHNVAATTYVSMLEQAGNRFEAPVALNCTPANLNDLDLIPAYETVLGRARLFSIDQGISYDPANLALMLVTNQIAEMYMLLGHEAGADSTDPTIGFFGNEPPADPTAAFCFEGQTPNLLEEELALLRGKSIQANVIRDADGFILATPYNRLLWNMIPGNNAGRIAYVNNYQFTEELDAINAYPQGHGDAWGHYLTAMKKYYGLLKHPVFEWINSTEFVLIAGQQPLEVSYQYERKFAEAAAAKAKTGAAVTTLTFRELYDADPTQQNGYPDDIQVCHGGGNDNDPCDGDGDCPNGACVNRAWGVADWGRRAGQGAYFDWLTANALLDDDDDDPDHQNTVRKVDRSTVLELGEIADAFAEIQTTLNNADAGLNPLGLATTVVPFGLDPGEIEEGMTHFDQIFERAEKALCNTVTVFNYANDNTRRLRQVQEDSIEFGTLTGEQETDFTNRLIEIFGRPYPEDIGPPPAAYSVDECPNGQCPDILHFDYVDASPQTGQPAPRTTVFHVTFDKTRTDPNTGVVTFVQSIVDFNVATNGLGLCKPTGWSTRLEPGALQLARSELLQAIGKYDRALLDYEIHLQSIQSEVGTLQDLYALHANVLMVQNDLADQEETLRDLILVDKAAELLFKGLQEFTKSMASAAATGIPGIIGAGFTVIGDAGAVPKGVVKGIAGVASNGFAVAAGVAEVAQVGLENSLANAQTAAAIEIAEYETNFEGRQQVAVVEKLIRETPALKLEIYTAFEAVNQAAGQYQAALGSGVRLLEQREAFRKKTAANVSRLRYQDIAFRVFRNEALQKFRAQFDLLARYVFLTARAYDYETNLLGSDPDSGRQFLTDIVKERNIGIADCSGGECQPQIGNGLSGKLALLNQNFDVLRSELGFNSPDEFDRTFSMRWENFRIPNTPEFDDEWRTQLEGFVIPNLNSFQPFRQLASPIPDAPNVNPAIVIPFSSTIQVGQNFFGHPSTGDIVLPPDRFAIKLHVFTVRFEDYPGKDAGLVSPVSVYLIPAGADIMRVPECPFPVRNWHLIDQTMPTPNPIGQQDIESPSWMPWDSLQGGAAALVKRRRIPTVGASEYINDNLLSLCDGTVPGDESFKLTGRSTWNDQWYLIIPESSLAGSDQVDGVDVFINGGGNIPGVKDIKLLICGYGYTFNDGCSAVARNPSSLDIRNVFREQPTGADSPTVETDLSELNR